MRKPCLLLVGACMAGPPTVRGWNEGLRVRQGRGCSVWAAGQNARASVRHTRAEPSPAPTVELQKGDKNFTLSLSVYGRGGALLHPGGLAAAQGFSGRAMLAPTMKLQNCDIFSRKPCLLLVGACMAGPPTVRGCIFGVAGAAQGRASNARPYDEILK